MSVKTAICQLETTSNKKYDGNPFVLYLLRLGGVSPISNIIDFVSLHHPSNEVNRINKFDENLAGKLKKFISPIQIREIGVNRVCG